MKPCLIIGPAFITTYPDVVELFKHHIVRGGHTTIYYYHDEKGDTVRAGECFWLTTLNTNREEKTLTKTYSKDKYPEYDNYPAIEVGTYKNIPIDYQGDIGVTTMILLRYNGNYDYEIVDGPVRPKLNGKTKFPRLIIRRKQL